DSFLVKVELARHPGQRQEGLLVPAPGNLGQPSDGVFQRRRAVARLEVQPSAAQMKERARQVGFAVVLGVADDVMPGERLRVLFENLLAELASADQLVLAGGSPAGHLVRRTKEALFGNAADSGPSLGA